jgi:hypothetical protein
MLPIELPMRLEQAEPGFGEVDIPSFGLFARRSPRLARLITRKSQYFVTSASFGLCTREDARSSSPKREKAWRNDRWYAMQTAFRHAPTLLMSNTRQNKKTSRKRMNANCSL